MLTLTSGLDGVQHLQAGGVGVGHRAPQGVFGERTPQATLSSGRVCRVASGGGPRTPAGGQGRGRDPQGPLPPCGLGVPTGDTGRWTGGVPHCSRGLFSPQPGQQVTSPGSGVPGRGQAGPLEGPAPGGRWWRGGGRKGAVRGGGGGRLIPGSRQRGSNPHVFTRGPRGSIPDSGTCEWTARPGAEGWLRGASATAAVWPREGHPSLGLGVCIAQGGAHSRSNPKPLVPGFPCGSLKQ